MDKKVTGIIIFLIAIAAFLGGAAFIQWQSRREGEISSGKGITPTPAVQQPTQALLGELTPTIGNFLVLGEDVCLEDDKLIIYFFGSQSCPHCSWEHPIFEEVVERFDGLVSFHNNMDQPQTDREIFQKYSQINQGGIPFMVLGCRYARVGSGERSGEEIEKENLTALICKLTDNQPDKVCQEVQDLVEQVEE